MARLRRWAAQRSGRAFGPGDRFAKRARSSRSPRGGVNPRPSDSTDRLIDRNYEAGGGANFSGGPGRRGPTNLSQQKLCRVLSLDSASPIRSRHGSQPRR